MWGWIFMPSELIPKNQKNNAPPAINGRIHEVLSEAVLQKASANLYRYETETVTRHFIQGVRAIRDMCKYVEQLGLRKTSIEYILIVDELKLRIQEVSNVIEKMNKKKIKPQLSENDKIKVLAIEDELKRFFGNRSGISLVHITPLLLEVSKE
jgi:hypothetical protein